MFFSSKAIVHTTSAVTLDYVPMMCVRCALYVAMSECMLYLYDSGAWFMVYTSGFR